VTVGEVDTVDYHAGGEPFRIVVAGLPEIPGDTLLARRDAAAADEQVDAVRRLLCHEPRGHADMYGCFLVPPDDPDAETGVLFWHGDGYSTACGHGTIALATWAVESGRVVVGHGGETPVVLDVPSGRVVARVRFAGGAVTGVAFRNVPSYAVARHVGVATSYGEVAVDLAYGGALYASAPASALGSRSSGNFCPSSSRPAARSSMRSTAPT
jgi:proline racemase